MILIMNFDIVIIGGGLVGASLAAALKHSGLSLALVESQPVPSTDHQDPDSWDSRMYALSPGSRAFLGQSGAWDLLDASRISPVTEMKVFGDTGAELEFSAYQMGVAELACILENRALHKALWRILQQQDNLEIINPARCASLSVGAGCAQLDLEDGRKLNAKLVVGADGRDSWLRNQTGMSASPVDYKQHGVVANFTCELPHRGIAYQWFQPEGILALLPLPENKVSMVWSTSIEHSAALLALTHEALCEQVANAAQHILGSMQVVTAPLAFPLRMLVLPKIISPRVALMGDAAHNMHPLAGQGVNTGFRDARELAQVMLTRGAQHDCGSLQLLRRYERKRKEDVCTMQAATYGLKHLFNNDLSLLRGLRNTGLTVTNHIPPLKKRLMQHALN